MAQPKRLVGTVKWFGGQKGFGFISPDEGGEDLFVHQTSIRNEGFRALYGGESVEFYIEHGGDGRAKALDVTSSSGGRGFSGGRGKVYGRGRRGGRMGIGGGGCGGGCYKCGKSGHMSRDCYQQGGGAGGGGRGGACCNCGEYGHLARECSE